MFLEHESIVDTAQTGCKSHFLYIFAEKWGESWFWLNWDKSHFGTPLNPEHQTPESETRQMVNNTWKFSHKNAKNQEEPESWEGKIWLPQMRSSAELGLQSQNPHGHELLDGKAFYLWGEKFDCKKSLWFLTFLSQICDSKFLTQQSLKTHVKSLHYGEKSFACKFCDNKYLSKGQLKVHERSHTKEKSFVCSVSLHNSINWRPLNDEVYLLDLQ